MAKWIIDAAHGGSDSGAIGLMGRRESDIVLEAAYEAKRLLEKNGETVLLTRVADIAIDLKTRADVANKWNADYFVSLHMNSFVNKSVTGSEILISENEYKAEGLAKFIKDELISNLESKDRGIKESNSEIFKMTNMQTVIVRAEFISNEEIEKNFDSKKYGYMIAKACLAKVDKVLIDLPVINPKIPSKSAWRVCIGYFKGYEDAEKSLDSTKKQGYKDAYIIPYEG
ncbi:N-acetylmuramoyl-L-alanine amidase family protein [Clostridium chauvoei]|uniref:N-acetylmuramoyl-L-alanine amidase n=2 Tax=Clostridium chauvoei TaxID=46867 RepID=A0ABD4RFJ5_9CLOT|nr:N-acetylmuramoyl-L-alanine amidase [Clostridium chauvoei]ATD55691.1 N-acetylmuramoyl-L-alanine amidase [Clostridium chauvoei]ATD56632.1 N-acetylmuramoyl-L-alanine amidase [Clostridium chauvoei]MBX7280066.1 N-acetylmuramoyl-L-alanine amidase [Clostridium chauvoei]MBX7282550.1 N-acetylmuramoyl-L-alanine amidase [Clostridium chauvoei]MBX7284957.1 N-acetylmuramoyl-L-alanine amidase [Clostridium chauvoei]